MSATSKYADKDRAGWSVFIDCFVMMTLIFFCHCHVTDSKSKSMTVQHQYENIQQTETHFVTVIDEETETALRVEIRFMFHQGCNNICNNSESIDRFSDQQLTIIDPN